MTCSSPPWPFKPLPLYRAVCVVLALCVLQDHLPCSNLFFFGLKSLPYGATNHHLNSSFFCESLDFISCCFIVLAILFQKCSLGSALSLAWIYFKILWEMLSQVVKEKQRTLFNVLTCTQYFQCFFFGVEFYGGVFLMEHLKLLFTFNINFFSFFPPFFFFHLSLLTVIFLCMF